ncbi:MAG: hypothetical protein LUC41_03240 [Clostridiales bacterium]|nr:hypothetical protein [Clostridiales bacterium]
MANKLKKLFSDEEPAIKLTIGFLDDESSMNFADALNRLLNEGLSGEIEGAANMKADIQIGDIIYPYKDYVDIGKINIYQGVKDIVQYVDTEFGKERIVFHSKRTLKELTLETDNNAIILLKLKCFKDTRAVNISFSGHPDRAKSIREAAEHFSMIFEFLKKYIIGAQNMDKALSDINNPDISRMLEYLYIWIDSFKKLLAMEEKLGIAFDPVEVSRNQDRESWKDLEELCYLLEKKVILRAGGKLRVDDDAGVNIDADVDAIVPGETMDLTYVGTLDYNLFGHSVRIYTANLLTNMTVKEKKKLDDGGIKILYTEDTERPMQIAYSGFVTEEAAQKELGKIMSHKELYTEALTLNEYVAKME